MNDLLAKIDSSLAKYLKTGHKKFQEKIDEAMEYSLLNGGKRIRPLLALHFCELCGGSAETAMPFACAVEMIHCYSLIHDDLPCMDNDEMRRGRPSNHIAFGEDMALLAGDGLLTKAFEIMLSPSTVQNCGCEKTVSAAGILAKCAGVSGTICRQRAKKLAY
ncbi:MAG: polyprenyl synthetase family protein [Oscillospiraceae bacterium]